MNTISFNSICIHDEDKSYTTTPHQLPIYATSSFEFSSISQGIDIFKGVEKGHVYGRYGNPTIDSVANKIAKLEGYGLDCECSAIMTSSGMSAITTSLSALLKSGDSILSQGNLYGGTTELLKKSFSRMGIQTHFINLRSEEEVYRTLNREKSIRAIYFETPSNPSLSCIDISVITRIAKEYGVLTIVDNTFPTPYLQQPFKYGVDIIIHSTTKYLNGHGNSIAGIVIVKDEDHRNRVWTAMKLLGTNCNPWDAWLTNNGIKTLSLRMDKHCSNAMKVARFLAEHEQVEFVNYNGLESHEDHLIAKSQMKDFGGMLSFEIKGGLQAGIDFMNKIQFCSLAPTLGDVDTLILHPASMSHLNVARELRLQNGITDGLIRVSVGIEDVTDIIADLEQAF